MPTNDPTDLNNALPNPWDRPQEEPENQTSPQGIDFGGMGDATDLASGGADLLGPSAVNGALEAAGGAIEGAADAAGGAIEGAGGLVEGLLGGLADGCGGCSLVLLVTLFAAAGTAMAFVR